MKNATRIISILLTLIFTFLMASCSFAPKADDSGGMMNGPSIFGDALSDSMAGGGEVPPGDHDGGDTVYGESDGTIADDSAEGSGEMMPGAEGDAVTDGAPDGGGDGTNPGTNPDIPTKPAGLITAGAWNDNDDYAYWQSLFIGGNDNDGKFYSFSEGKSWGFDSQNRIKVTVRGKDGNAVCGSHVYAKDENGTTLFSAVTNSAGVAYLFACEDAKTVTAESGAYAADTDVDGGELTITLDGYEEKRNVIDIMFVVDVTGSMGDELNYLKAELGDVITRVCRANKDAIINLALLFYRDKTDSEIYKYFDFTNVNSKDGLTAQLEAINSQYASGGGDYPEAVDGALELALNAQWSSSTSTKLIFHLLDAPPHSSQENKSLYKSSVERAAEMGIRICPIICSGTDTLTEYLVREASIYTGGTFIFVTDDSGIGNPHHDPELPNVTVEALNSLLVRLIEGYYTGEFAPPEYWKTDTQK